jgi:outer membrane protein assembly factor BamB
MSLNPGDGSELWRVRFKGYSVVPRPVYAEGLLYVTTCYDKSTLIAIRPDGKGDVTTSHVAWKVEKNVPNNPGVVVVDGLLYMVSDTGIASCLDAKTGSAVWSERVTDKYTSAILHVPGRVYLQSEDGTGTALKTGRTFETIAINKLGERTLASYAVIGSDLLIRTDKHLYRIGNGGK